MNTLKDVKTTVRALVGDPMGDFTTDAYLLPLINQVYAQQTTRLMAETGSSFDERVQDCPNVDAGTTSLARYQAATMVNDMGRPAINGPLFGLITPVTLEFKILAQQDGTYREATRKSKLSNVSYASSSPIVRMEWAWRGGVIWLVPVLYPLDLRVTGEFNPPRLVADSDFLQVHLRMGEATAYGTAALIGVERNNQNFVSNYSGQATAVLEDIENILIRAEQGTTSRIGR